MKEAYDFLEAYPHIVGGSAVLILSVAVLAAHRPDFTAGWAATIALGFVGAAMVLEVLAPLGQMSLVDLLLLNRLGVSSVLVEAGYALLLFAAYRAARSPTADP